MLAEVFPVTCNFHPHYFVSHRPATTEWLEAAIATAHQHGLPVMNAARMLAWWEKRAAVTGSCTRDGDTWKYTLSSADQEVALAVPAQWNGRAVEGGRPLPGTGEVLLAPGRFARYSGDVI